MKKPIVLFLLVCLAAFGMSGCASSTKNSDTPRVEVKGQMEGSAGHVSK